MSEVIEGRPFGLVSTWMLGLVAVHAALSKDMAVMRECGRESVIRTAVDPEFQCDYMSTIMSWSGQPLEKIEEKLDRSAWDGIQAIEEGASSEDSSVGEFPSVQEVADNDPQWVGLKEAADRLGVNIKRIQRFGERGEIRTVNPTGRSPRRYFLPDIDDLRDNGRLVGGIRLYPRDGELSLTRAASPWKGTRLIEEIDRAWAVLYKHGLLKGELAEQVRANVAYAALNSKCKGCEFESIKTGPVWRYES